MPCYRVQFEDNQTVLITVTPEDESPGLATLSTASVYRPPDANTKPQPWRRTNGEPFRFTGLGEAAALKHACSVLQVLHGRILSLSINERCECGTTQTIEIAANCTECGWPSQVTFLYGYEGNVPAAGRWKCPHCGFMQTVNAIGTVVKVMKGEKT